MSEHEIQLIFGLENKQRVVRVGSTVAPTIAELVAAVPALAEPAQLQRYTDALNYLARGDQYRPIADPDRFRAEYEQRFQAEDPAAHFHDGAPQIRLFGHSNLDEIQAPRVEGESVIFYAEHNYLGVPYRVTGPAPGAGWGDQVRAGGNDSPKRRARRGHDGAAHQRGVVAFG